MPCNPVDFSTFRKLESKGEIDGLIIAWDYNAIAPIVNICKFYGVQNVAYVDSNNPVNKIIWLDNSKSFMPRIDTDLIDSCNLNCKACSHFANLFNDGDFYKLEDFRRDIRRLSEIVDLGRLRMMGGEPLKLKNLDEYIKVARQYLPNTNLYLVTNALLIPTVSQKILDTLRENDCIVQISGYPPTVKILDKIKDILIKNNLRYEVVSNTQIPIKIFFRCMSLKGGHDPMKSRRVCHNDVCRFLRNGKMYKCPPDALCYKFEERFNIKNFPMSTGIDLYAPNFSLLLEQLNGNIERCSWCNETDEEVAWKVENKPKFSDWIVDENKI